MPSSVHGKRLASFTAGEKLAVINAVGGPPGILALDIADLVNVYGDMTDGEFEVSNIEENEAGAKGLNEEYIVTREANIEPGV
ncbi:hypothetical protein V7S43_004788 [Phytophthora oleae]|uniref:Uncharacterized protein n=1 Tax=Phytophthora oleae TaxID=2107226 RepID=A0ABD3FW65_9STRA